MYSWIDYIAHPTNWPKPLDRPLHQNRHLGRGKRSAWKSHYTIELARDCNHEEINNGPNKEQDNAYSWPKPRGLMTPCALGG